MTRPLTEIVAEMREVEHYDTIHGKFAKDWADEIEAAMQEPVACVVKNATGQVFLSSPDYSPFDISNHVGVRFFAAPPAAEPSEIILPYEGFKKVDGKYIHINVSKGDEGLNIYIDGVRFISAIPAAEPSIPVRVVEERIKAMLSATVYGPSHDNVVVGELRRLIEGAK